MINSFSYELKYDVKYLWLRRIIYLIWSVFYVIMGVVVAIPVGLMHGIKGGIVQLYKELKAGWINL